MLCHMPRLPQASDAAVVYDDCLNHALALFLVLRMLAKYVGEQRFLEGVTLYLKKRLYGNSVSRDLWECVSEATGFDIARLMDNWVTKVSQLLEDETVERLHVNRRDFQ